MTNRFTIKPNKTLEEIGGLNAANRAQVEYNKEVNKVFNDDTWNEGLDGIIDKFTIPVAAPENFRGAYIKAIKDKRRAGGPDFKYKESSGNTVRFAVTTQDKPGYIIRCNYIDGGARYYAGHHNQFGLALLEKQESSAIKLKYNSEAVLLANHLDLQSNLETYHEVLIR